MTTPRIPSDFPGLEELARRARYFPREVEVLPGDVGRRRYLRLVLDDGTSVIGVVYPAEEADSRLRWNSARDVLRERLQVPLLIADDQMGNQIIEDFGRHDLAARFADRSEERNVWLGHAVDSAALIAGLPDPAINPPFDAATFRRELDLAREAVFDLWLGAPLSPEHRDMHDRWADSLAREIETHPRVLCHRDFHANNLFPSEGRVALIDFQDLRSGPDSYDLASLLWERSTLDWMTVPDSRRQASRFARALGIDTEGLEGRLRRVLLQRAWKVCGTFARAVAQGRGDTYRRYLPGEIALVGRLLGPAPPDRAFRAVYEARLAPLC
ncbi:MAG TPA: phosphotransferase [Thermoanaerobaculia bacterium]